MVRFCADYRIKPHAPQRLSMTANFYDYNSCERVTRFSNFYTLLTVPDYFGCLIRFATWTSELIFLVFIKLKYYTSLLISKVAFAIDSPPYLFTFNCYTRNSTKLKFILLHFHSIYLFLLSYARSSRLTAAAGTEFAGTNIKK